MSNENLNIYKKTESLRTIVSDVTKNSKTQPLSQTIYSLTISRVISVSERAPHISMVSSSSAASFCVST